MNVNLNDYTIAMVRMKRPAYIPKGAVNFVKDLSHVDAIAMKMHNMFGDRTHMEKIEMIKEKAVRLIETEDDVFEFVFEDDSGFILYRTADA